MEFSEYLLGTSERQKQSIENEFLSKGKYTRASFEVLLMIAKSKKLYSIGKELLLAMAIKMSSIVYSRKDFCFIFFILLLQRFMLSRSVGCEYT